MIKIILVAITALFLVIIAGSIKREYGFIIAVAASVIISFYGLSKITVMAEKVREFQQFIGWDREYLTILLKMLGIAYLTQFAVNLCRDAGQGAIASQIGFAGKISMLIVSFPVLESLIKTVGELFI